MVVCITNFYIIVNKNNYINWEPEAKGTFSQTKRSKKVIKSDLYELLISQPIVILQIRGIDRWYRILKSIIF